MRQAIIGIFLLKIIQSCFFCGRIFFSVVFWFGDLNFRIEELEMYVVKAAIDNNKLSMLWDKDQVRDVQVENDNG